MKKFDVFFTRNGYAQIEAETKEEAERIAQQLKYDDVSWDDDWNPVDIVEGDIIHDAIKEALK